MSNAQHVNQKELRVVGMSRSGTHAIINWLMAQAPGRYCFVNCAQPGANPFKTARELDNGQPCQTNIEDFDLAQEQQGEMTRKDLLIHSYEDCFLGMTCSREFEAKHDEYVGASRVRRDVLILRDPFNLFASRLRAGLYRGHGQAQPNMVTWRTAARIWRQHARAFVGDRDYFTQPLTTISYNRWVHDAGYRRQIAEELGLEFTDAGIDHVPGVAGGSSFDGTTFHGRPEQMKTDQRWRHYRHDPDFWTLFSENELIALSQRIFGPAPAPLYANTRHCA